MVVNTTPHLPGNSFTFRWHGLFGLLFWLAALVPFRTAAQSTAIEDFTRQRQAEEQAVTKSDSKAQPKRNTINVYSVLFATGSATLTDKDKKSLTNEIIPYILRFSPTSEITIEGHTDDTGGAKANLALSQRRADSVLTFLASQGINQARLVAKGYGEYKPLVRLSTPEARARNRRVSLIIEDPGSSTIVLTNGQRLVGRDVVDETDGTISFRKSDTEPRMKVARAEVSHILYPDKTSYNPNTGITGTIHLKNGQEIPARVIAREPGIISYKKKDTDPVMIRLAESEVQYIQYADGSVYRPNQPTATGTTAATAVQKQEMVVFRDLKKVKVTNLKETPAGVAYQLQGAEASLESPKKELYYVVFATGRTKYYNIPYVKFNLWEKLPHLTRFSVFGNAGIVPLTVKQATINFAYVDESPSQDRMRSIVDLKRRYFGYGLQLGGEGEIDSSLILRGYYQLAFNSEGLTNAAGFGIGKVIGKKRQTRIGVDLQFGNAYVRLGELYQNAQYIQVNDSRFYSNSVSVRYRNYYAALHPYISFEKPLKKNLFLRFSAGVAAGLHTRSLITFRGKDGDDKKVKASERLTAPNVTFNVNGVKSTNARLFSILGPQLSAGIYYSILNR